MEVQRRLMVLNQRVKTLENENSVLKQRLSDIAYGQEDVQSYMRRNGINDILQITDSGMKSSASSDSVPSLNGSMNLLNLSSNNSSTLSLNTAAAPPVPPRTSVSSNGNQSPDPVVGTRLEGLLLNEMEDDFNPRANEPSSKQKFNGTTSSSPVTPPMLAPPPKSGRDIRSNQNSSARAGVDEVFGSPTTSAIPRPKPKDPFEMGHFSYPVNGNADASHTDYSLGILDKKIMEMKDGFSRGLAISTENFSLESLDPLKN